MARVGRGGTGLETGKWQDLAMGSQKETGPETGRSERKGVVEGKRGDLGGRRIIKKKKKTTSMLSPACVLGIRQ